jgi:hypothetical protein
MRSRSPADRGSVTAELAAAMPAVIVVLALCAGTLQSLTQRALLTDAAAQAARSLARGDGVPAGVVPAGADLAEERPGDLVCVSIRQPAGGALAALGIPVAARSCALGGGL